MHLQKFAAMLPGTKSINEAGCNQEANQSTKQRLAVFRKQIDKPSRVCFFSGRANRPIKQSLLVFRKQITNQAEPACIPEASRPIDQSLLVFRKQIDQLTRSLLVFRKQIDQSSRACLYSGSKSTNQAVPSCVPESNQAVKQELSLFRKTNYN
jgi:hypothetical protein